jgi:DNA-binding SARP family transcriptional activator
MQDQPATPSCSRNHAQSNNQSPPSLDIHFLGPLRVFANDCPIEDWPNCKGKAVFKYLVTHRERPVPRDVLMEQFWPSSGADAARNSLNVAVYGLRKILAKAHPAFSFVLFQDGSYSLNPELQIWVDSEAFLHHLRLGRELERRGQEELAIHEYRAAEVLYQDEFLVEDRYEDWLVPLRQRLRDQYLTVLARLSGFYFDKREHETFAMLCTKMLAVDPCNEEPHRRLMRCYSRLGQPHLALRQYHVCRDTLDRELNLAPGQETTELLARIQRGQVA